MPPSSEKKLSSLQSTSVGIMEVLKGVNPEAPLYLKYDTSVGFTVKLLL